MAEQPAADALPRAPSGRRGPGTTLTAVTYWYAASAVVILAVIFGGQLVRRPRYATSMPEGIPAVFVRSDGPFYARIAETGYIYRADQPSDVVFYPAYPMLGRGLSWLTGLSAEWSLLVVSQAALAGACVVGLAYVKRRQDVGPPAPVSAARRDAQDSARDGALRESVPEYALLSLLLFPTSIFARMAYTEALFLFLSALALYALARRWPLWAIAAAIGAATATRAVGAALIPVLMLFIATEGRNAGISRRRILLRWCVYLPLACWGLAAFMLYLHVEFGDAFASIKNTALWRMRPAVPWHEHLLKLLTLEPIWSVYTPSSPAYWATAEAHGAFPFSLQFANPLYFVFAVVCLLVGIRHRWLNRYEALFMALLLAIPYFTTSYSVCMAGMGRFVGAMLPLHIVIGHVLARLPAPLAALLLALSGALLAAYAALFAAGYPIV